MVNANKLRIVAGLGILLIMAGCATAPQPAVMRTPNDHQQVYATPDEAVAALVAAARTPSPADDMKILGSKAEKILRSGDKVADMRGREKFLAAYDKAHELETQPNGNEVLVVGEEEWPMPIPLQQARNGWWFDTAAGEQEILNRRVGKNELSVMKVARAYLDAQRDYAELSGTHEYAQHLVSSEGMHDGLYWPVAEGEPESPLGPLIAKATAQGYEGKNSPERAPYHGYFYKILTRQGPHATEGAKNYIVKGHMTGGFALLAYPARWGDSGVMTFIMSEHGIIYEKNFGTHTADIARHITQFDPDSSWKVVE
jgi:Protein of unknown function (DUF2950)